MRPALRGPMNALTVGQLDLSARLGALTGETTDQVVTRLGVVAPWNGIPHKLELDSSKREAVLNAQVAAFRAAGFDCLDLTDSETRRYGIHGNTANNALFSRRLRDEGRAGPRQYWHAVRDDPPLF